MEDVAGIHPISGLYLQEGKGGKEEGNRQGAQLVAFETDRPEGSHYPVFRKRLKRRGERKEGEMWGAHPLLCLYLRSCWYGRDHYPLLLPCAR